MGDIETLVRRAARGESEAYEGLYERFKEMALGYAFSILGDIDLAEDARQEAFMSAYLDLVSLKDPKAFPGWFKRIVRNHAITIQRGRRTLTVPLEDAGEIPAGGVSPAEMAQRGELQQQVNRRINALPGTQSEAVRLYYLDGMSLAEISERTGWKAGLVKSRLYAGRERLRQGYMKQVKREVLDKRLASDPKVERAATNEALRVFDEEIAALFAGPSDEQCERAVDLFCAKGRMMRFMGEYEKAIESMQEGFRHPQLKKNGRYRSRFEAEMGLTYLQMAEYDEARVCLRRSRDQIKRRGETDSLLMASVLNGLGLCAWGSGRFRQAHKYYEQCFELAHKKRCREMEAEASNNLGLIAWKEGKLSDALGFFKKSLKHWNTLNNRFGFALTSMNIGIIEENMGRFNEARKRYQGAIDMAEEINFAQIQAAGTCNLGNLALAEGDWEEGFELSQTARKLSRRIKDRRGENIALENQVLALMKMGRIEKASKMLKEAQEMAIETGDKERLLSLDLVGVEISLAESNLEDIYDRLEAADRIVQQGGYVSEYPRLLRLVAHAELMGGDRRETRRTLNRAIRICEQQRNAPELAKLRAIEAELDEL